MVAGESDLNKSSSFRTPPKYSIGGASTGPDRHKGMPGPGQYPALQADKDKFHKSASWTMSGLPKDLSKMFQPPGPGTYKPLPQDTGLKFGWGSEPRLREIKRSNTPGPGNYDIPTSLKGKDVSISSKPEGGARRHANPGPGTYKPNHAPSSMHRSSPCISFGGGNRAELGASKYPGPGQYDLPSTLCGNVAFPIPPKFSFKGKPNPPKSHETPGPLGGFSTFT